MESSYRTLGLQPRPGTPGYPSGTKCMCASAPPREGKLGHLSLTTLPAFGLGHIQPDTHQVCSPKGRETGPCEPDCAPGLRPRPHTAGYPSGPRTIRTFVLVGGGLATRPDCRTFSILCCYKLLIKGTIPEQGCAVGGCCRHCHQSACQDRRKNQCHSQSAMQSA